MNKVISNPCMRCGKERVVVKKWKEKSGDSVIMVTESSCPDAECQKKVEFENKRQRDKTASMRLKSKQRAIERSAERAAKKTAKKPKKSVL